MTTTEKPATPYQVVGTRPVRPDGVDKVTGRAEYGADIRLPGMLYGRVLRSPHAHAVIKRLDVSRALADPRVFAVVTTADFPVLGNNPIQTIRGPIPERWTRESIIADGKALFKGHAIAAIATSDPHLSEDLLSLIDVEYEVLKPVLNIEQALSPDFPLLHEPSVTAEIKGLFEPYDGRQTNVARQLEIRRGDIEAGFAGSDVVIEREFSLPPGVHRAPQCHGVLEQGRAAHHLDEHAGRLRRPRRRLDHPESAGQHGEGGADGDRRRLRRKDSRLPGSRRGPPLEEVWAPSPGHDVACRGLRGHRPDLRHRDPRENGREA
jgi:CO/xanthine dehydrogenase Mo-binding subunit